MKDKRTYLKIASIIEFIYVFIMSIYYLFFNKLNDEVIASLFLLLIGLFFGIVLYKESNKELSYLKKNNLKITIASFYLLLEPIIPGVLSFIFLSSIKDKKRIILPEIREKELTNKEKIKALLIFLSFILIMFVLPLFSFYKKISPLFLYILIFIGIFVLYFKELKENFIIFKNNIKKYIPFIIKRYFIMLGIMILVAFPIILINKGEVSTNQQMVNNMFSKIPLLTFLLTTLYAPFTEEVIFRLSLSKIIKNNTLYIIISGLLFGTAHMIDKFSSMYDLLYIFQYASLGICLSKAYKDTDNIFVPMSMHFIQNFMASLLVILIY